MCDTGGIATTSLVFFRAQEAAFSSTQAPSCGICRRSKRGKRHSLLHRPLLRVVLVSQSEGSGILFYIGLRFWEQAKQEKRFSLLHRPQLVEFFCLSQQEGSKRHSLLHRPQRVVFFVGQGKREASGILSIYCFLWFLSIKAREAAYSST